MTGIQMRGVSAPPGARLEGEGTAAAVAVFVKWLSLAATPAFASMALLTGLDTGPTDSLCPAGATGHLSGTAAMYLLMSVFHLPPWLRLFERRIGSGPS